MPRPSRNDPCPCGSGLKFKKCCMSISQQRADASDEALSLRAAGFKNLSEENWDQAIDNFRQSLEIAPQQLDVLQAVASCYEGLEDYLRAAEYYERAVALCPAERRFEMCYQLGVARVCAHRLDKAEEAFRQSLEACSNPSADQHLREVLRNIERIRNGEISPYAFMVQVQLQRAFSDMELERYQLAAHRLHKISEIDPENSAIFYNLGVVYNLLGEEDQALEHYQRSVDLNPHLVQSLYNMGQICLLKTKDVARALNFFERAVAIRPDYIGAHHQRGVACEMLGELDKAIACWQRTLELDPENKMANENLRRVCGTDSAESNVKNGQENQ